LCNGEFLRLLPEIMADDLRERIASERASAVGAYRQLH
jgi:hypothetical protein